MTCCLVLVTPLETFMEIFGWGCASWAVGYGVGFTILVVKKGLDSI
jgi:hypothetical protein